MNRRPLKIAVVGHTNTGKTSLVRTLTHDREFGEVFDRGGTTRQVTRTALADAEGTLIELYDSPGLENAPELIEWLDRQPGSRHEGPERIRRLFDDTGSREAFDHEARVLELMLDVDVALYVIDAREPVLEKYQDELAVLALCARPIVAVLNFTASSESREAEWRDALARVTLHTVIAFDAAVRNPETERRLFEKLKSQLDGFAPVLDEWLAQRRREEEARRRAALHAVAEMLVDCAGLVRTVSGEESGRREEVRREIRQAVRRREQACVETLLDLFRFGRETYPDTELPLADGRWQADPFDPETLRHYGIRTSGYLAAGAGAGAAVDVGTGGLSLGTGTVIGAVLGAGAGLARTAGRNLTDRWRGLERLLVDDATLRLLAARQMELVSALIRRGHGAPGTITPRTGDGFRRGRLPAPMRRARHHPEWSALNGSRQTPSARESAADALVPVLASELDRPS